MSTAKPKKEKIPRFVLTITDTKTEIVGPHGKQHLSISIGAPRLSDFAKKIAPEKRKNAGRTEFEAMLLFFAEQADKTNVDRKAGEVKEYKIMELPDLEEGEGEK